MKRKFFRLAFYSLLIAPIIGCSQSKQYTPHPGGSRYNLTGMPAELVNVQVNDWRAEKEDSRQLTQAIKGQILSALSSEQVPGHPPFYNLQVNIIEHRSFFTLGDWNASTRLRIKLKDPQGNIIGDWRAEGSSHRSNMQGNATARAVLQDAYNIAIADMMSILSAVSLVH